MPGIFHRAGPLSAGTPTASWTAGQPRGAGTSSATPAFFPRPWPGLSSRQPPPPSRSNKPGLAGRAGRRARPPPPREPSPCNSVWLLYKYLNLYSGFFRPRPDFFLSFFYFFKSRRFPCFPSSRAAGFAEGEALSRVTNPESRGLEEGPTPTVLIFLCMWRMHWPSSSSPP